jgi:putative membrane protein
MRARTLILSIDRDDDVGYKAGVESPAVGREACLDAATRLGIADPEDSDTNAIFQAIKTYDQLKAEGEDVEVAVIGGNHMNMLEGDRRIGELLEQVIGITGSTDCILISDGAEDEYVLPIIQSHLKVASVVRVIIKQLPNIEGTYYIIKKLLNDPKIARSVLLPVGLVLLLYALVALLAPGISAVLVAVGIIGLYLLFKGFNFDQYFVYVWHAITESFRKGQFSFIAYLVAVILVIAGIISGLMSVIANYPNSGDVGILYLGLTFLYGALIWVIVAGLVASAGKITDYVQNYQAGISRIFVVPFFFVAIGMIAYGAVIYFLSISPVEPFPFTTTDGIIAMMLLTITGLGVAFLGIYLRPRVQKQVRAWIEMRLKLEEEETNGKKRKPAYKKVKY